MLDKLITLLNGHRLKSFITCDETCFCWVIENFINTHARDAELPWEPTTMGQNGASLLVTWDNSDDGGMDVDVLKKKLRGKHGWLTVKYFANGQAQMFLAPHSNRP